MNNNPAPSADFRVNIRFILSAMWTSVMFLYIYGDYFELYVPHKAEGLLTGRNLLNTPYRLLFATILLALPALMISVTLVLHPKWNRPLHIVVGAVLTLFTLFAGSSAITEWRIFYVMLSIFESTITSLIVWKAWHWPQQ